jgi:hypothetical protein
MLRKSPAALFARKKGTATEADGDAFRRVNASGCVDRDGPGGGPGRGNTVGEIRANEVEGGEGVGVGSGDAAQGRGKGEGKNLGKAHVFRTFHFRDGEV